MQEQTKPARYPGDGVRELSVQAVPDDRLYMRQTWIDGSGGGVTFVLDTTQGLGGATMILAVTMADGTVKRESIDMRNVLPGWIDAMVQDHARAS